MTKDTKRRLYTLLVGVAVGVPIAGALAQTESKFSSLLTGTMIGGSAAWFVNSKIKESENRELS